jgi:hypothetical protein
MLIGDIVTYDGRMHVVVGFTPTSVTPGRVDRSRDGMTFWVDLQQIGSGSTAASCPARIATGARDSARKEGADTQRLASASRQTFSHVRLCRSRERTNTCFSIV